MYVKKLIHFILDIRNKNRHDINLKKQFFTIDKPVSF